MARHIRNLKKLHSIIEQHPKHSPEDPFIFSSGEALRIRQLIAESLVAFFAKLNGLSIPTSQPIPNQPKSSKPASSTERHHWRHL